MTLSQSRNPLSVSLCQLNTPADLQEAQRLRYDVWQSEGAEVHHSERRLIADEHDDHAAHWGVFDKELLVGAARLCLHRELREAPTERCLLIKVCRVPSLV
jgi:putative hemolysin